MVTAERGSRQRCTPSPAEEAQVGGRAGKPNSKNCTERSSSQCVAELET